MPFIFPLAGDVSKVSSNSFVYSRKYSRASSDAFGTLLNVFKIFTTVLGLESACLGLTNAFELESGLSDLSCKYYLST